jgi:hypothetical protein
MREIPAGHVALVDDEDYEFVRQYSWHRKTDIQGMIYARRKLPITGDGVRHAQMMHSLITGWGWLRFRNGRFTTGR